MYFYVCVGYELEVTKRVFLFLILLGIVLSSTRSTLPSEPLILLLIWTTVEVEGGGVI